MANFSSYCVIGMTAVLLGCVTRNKLPEQDVIQKPTATLNKQGIRFISIMMKDDIDNRLSGNQTILTVDDIRLIARVDDVVSAKQYESDFEENEIAATQRYSSRKILLFGQANSINIDAIGKGYITLLSNNPAGVQARLSDKGFRRAGEVKKGRTTGLVCSVGPKVLGIETAADCLILQQYLEELSPSIEEQSQKFLNGQTTLPKRIGAIEIMGYVIGSHLPADSSCFNDASSCDAAVKKADKSSELDMSNEAKEIQQRVHVK